MATPRKTPTPKTSDTAGVLVELNSDVDRKLGFEETEPLFVIDGVVYEARTTFSAGEAIRYAKTYRDEGIDQAVAYAMVQAIGADGYKAFLEYPYLSNDNASKIIGQVTGRINPVAADPKSRKAS